MHAVDNTQQLFLAIIYLKKFVLAAVVAFPSYMLKVPNNENIRRKTNFLPRSPDSARSSCGSASSSWSKRSDFSKSNGKIKQWDLFGRVIFIYWWKLSNGTPKHGTPKHGTPEQHHSGTRVTGPLKIINYSLGHLCPGKYRFWHPFFSNCW